MCPEKASHHILFHGVREVREQEFRSLRSRNEVKCSQVASYKAGWSPCRVGHCSCGWNKRWGGETWKWCTRSVSDGSQGRSAYNNGFIKLEVEPATWTFRSSYVSLWRAAEPKTLVDGAAMARPIQEHSVPQEECVGSLDLELRCQGKHLLSGDHEAFELPLFTHAV